MTDEEYRYFCEESMKLKIQNFKAIKEQTELNAEAKAKAKKFYDVEDKLYNLYKKGMKKFKEVHNPLISPEDYTKFESLLYITELYANKTDEINEYIKKMNEIPELKEAGELEKERQTLFYDYAISHLKLDSKINESKEKLFSKEYLRKMDEFAEQGVMLYFLETPDVPLLDPIITPQKVIESLLYADCLSLKEIYKTFIECPEPGISMQRKINDIIDVFENLSFGGYRSAARTLFALIESEIKNISTVLEGFFEKEKEYKNGKQRSEKIEEITEYIDMPNAKKQWKKINSYYEKIVTGKDPMIDRNKIIHGDYNDSAIDINEYDIVKLMLLYITIRMQGDYIQFHVSIFENALIYVNVNVAQMLKNKKQ